MGLREQKKAKSRKLISDLATGLFLEKGYDNVTTSEIARLAEVSTKTLFNYFPTKESLVFDEDEETESRLIATVRDRKKGQRILDSLLAYGCAKIDSTKGIERKSVVKFMAFIYRTPELNSYAQQMWMRHEHALANVIREEAKTKPRQIEAEAIARFVLDSFWRALRTPNPKASLRELFKLIEKGWLE